MQAPFFLSKISISPDHHALFLDFDGTLADIAPQPHAVRVPADLVALLERTYQDLGGALAIISGRQVAVIDSLLAPLRLPAAGEHGAQWRNSDGDFFELDNQSIRPALEPIVQAAEQLVNVHSELLIERKTAGFALHYRMAPALYTVCWNTLMPMVQRTPALALIRGKYVLEVVCAAVDKGTAIRNFLKTPPFAGRTPIFTGDDATDEAGFAAVQELGGYGIKVGAGPSLAKHRCPNPTALREWLGQAAGRSQRTVTSFLSQAT